MGEAQQVLKAMGRVTFQPLLSLASCFAPGQAQHASAVILLLGESTPIAADGGNLEEDAWTDDN